MNLLVLIDPIEGGRFRARAGEPFAVSAEGNSAEEATRHLETLLRDRLRNGTRLALLDLESGPTSEPAPLRLEPLPDDDWFFRTMRDVIAENRKREDEASG